jgi:hypothetical protein
MVGGVGGGKANGFCAGDAGGLLLFGVGGACENTSFGVGGCPNISLAPMGVIGGRPNTGGGAWDEVLGGIAANPTTGDDGGRKLAPINTPPSGGRNALVDPTASPPIGGRKTLGDGGGRKAEGDSGGGPNPPLDASGGFEASIGGVGGRSKIVGGVGVGV